MLTITDETIPPRNSRGRTGCFLFVFFWIYHALLHYLSWQIWNRMAKNAGKHTEGWHDISTIILQQFLNLSSVYLHEVQTALGENQWSGRRLHSVQFGLRRGITSWKSLILIQVLYLIKYLSTRWDTFTNWQFLSTEGNHVCMWTSGRPASR